MRSIYGPCVMHLLPLCAVYPGRSGSADQQYGICVAVIRRYSYRSQYWGTVITNGTLNISSLLIAPVIGYCLSRNKGFDNPMAAAIVSLAALVVMMPNVVSVTPLEGGESVAVSGALTFGNVGTQAMFAGVIIGLIATELFVWISGIKKLQIDLGDSIPPSVGKSFKRSDPVHPAVIRFWSYICSS